MTQKLVPIRLQIAAEQGFYPPMLLGGFSHQQLITCVWPDHVTWNRKPGEGCWEFEERILADLHELAASEQMANAHV